ncbi:MAG: type II toxin-antitoxin system YafQ family toxin [Prevotella sp.]|jgi:mRNA interferase YafQ|nr:type II toxin-antitoxin system YafQ family toxin [Prevotella sp.]
MKYSLSVTTRFKKDLKKMIKQGQNLSLINEVVDSLLLGDVLMDKYKDHALSGRWIGYRECHILPDWLLIYRIEEDILILTLTRTGSHSELFD